MNKLFDKADGNLNEMREYVKKKLNINCKDSDVITFYRYLDEKRRCIDCKGIENCKQDSKGYMPIINEQTSTLSYISCEYRKKYVLDMEKKNLVETLYLPKKILEADITDYYLNNDSRNKAFAYATKFISGFSRENYIKGMLLYGKYGVGKTYLLAAIANELAKKNIKALLVYFPDLARDLKNAINLGTLEEKINNLKTVDVLMIDDIGSEMMTSWLRDEILGPVLQYRKLDQKPVFFSTNETVKTLINHLSNTKEADDTSKGYRVYNHINELTERFEIEE